jgi:hypothetical protein
MSRRAATAERMVLACGARTKRGCRPSTRRVLENDIAEGAWTVPATASNGTGARWISETNHGKVRVTPVTRVPANHILRNSKVSFERSWLQSPCPPQPQKPRPRPPHSQIRVCNAAQLLTFDVLIPISQRSSKTMSDYRTTSKL